MPCDRRNGITPFSLACKQCSGFPDTTVPIRLWAGFGHKGTSVTFSPPACQVARRDSSASFLAGKDAQLVADRPQQSDAELADSTPASLNKGGAGELRVSRPARREPRNVVAVLVSVGGVAGTVLGYVKSLPGICKAWHMGITEITSKLYR